MEIKADLVNRISTGSGDGEVLVCLPEGEEPAVDWDAEVAVQTFHILLFYIALVVWQSLSPRLGNVWVRQASKITRALEKQVLLQPLDI